MRAWVFTLGIAWRTFGLGVVRRDAAVGVAWTARVFDPACVGTDRTCGSCVPSTIAGTTTDTATTIPSGIANDLDVR